MAKTTVVVVDDSALIRALLTEIINGEPDLQVVGAAADPYQAREIIRNTNPNVVTLDVEMPRMDGLDFLEKIMRLRPMPVVMVSTLTERGAEVTMRALELGAVDFVAKPKLGVANGMREMGAAICEKIRIAAKSRVFRKAAVARAPGAAAPVKGVATFSRHSTEKMIVIGASTGGTEAIREVLETFPADCPAVVITQHMPPGFTASFAKRLDGCCRIRVAEARQGERILPGHAYIAPGGQHMAVGRSGANYVIELHDTEPVNRHKPSVEVLFKSVAKNVGPNAIGVMLTGMGKDGALAMLDMKRAGAFNMAQDEATCVVYGMPREAVACGAVDSILPLGQIGPAVIEKLMAGGKVLSRV
ncbi:protein-glutamate methylesterase/protein-glutamine glutaminase [Derxia gummosa]|uniref:Protein-glutamate methylesterase/protein-glutamine glutaminase n=1 Tax=Derxia gummosa DSM 723 TaxID=1121388 RepID=A0A8B6X0W6_9BURK|nr:chemotaxis response regulator protein-glutamate methylesterase [Derxia gummosa]